MSSSEEMGQRIVDEVVRELMDLQPDVEARIRAAIQDACDGCMTVKCPSCGGPMLLLTGKFGDFWGCERFPQCKGTIDASRRKFLNHCLSYTADWIVDNILRLDLLPNTKIRVKETIQRILMEGLPAPEKRKTKKKVKVTKRTRRARTKSKRCDRCDCPIEGGTTCKVCTKIACQPKKCPLCSGPMELRTGYLGDFWGCVRFPRCDGTISARGTYMRKFSKKGKADEKVD